MHHQSVVLSVQDSAQLAQGRLQVELLEGGVGHSFYWISPVHFTLGTQNINLSQYFIVILPTFNSFALRLPMVATPTIFPLSVMTGSWSKPSWTMISMACSTVTLGRMERGADRSRELTFSSAHHVFKS